jgi:predicted double-glycine peptidase
MRLKFASLRVALGPTRLMSAMVLVFAGVLVSSVSAAELPAVDNRPAVMSISIGGGGPLGRMIIKPRVKPLSFFKERHVVKQTLDFSCGAASTATIFKFYLGEQVTEKKVIEDMFKAGNVNKIIERQGFSLLDIKRFAEFMGYRAVGYKTDIEGLVLLNKPSIVAIMLRDYKHFVVFRGAEEGKVFLADPALGNTTLTAREFEQMWYGHIALVIEPRDKQVRPDLQIEQEDKLLVTPTDLRRSLYYNAILFGKSPKEF